MRWHGSGSVTIEDNTAHPERVRTATWGRRRIHVGIGGLAATNEPDVAIQTMALGSCVGIMVFDPATQVLAMAHIALPTHAGDLERAGEEPGRYGDTVVPALIRTLGRFGCDPRSRRVQIKLAGGANVLGDSNLFDIGRRNSEAIDQALEAAGLVVHARDLGGRHSRTVLLQPGGAIRLSCPAREPWAL